MLDARDPFAAFIGSQGGVGREQDAFGHRDRLALGEAGLGRDQQALHPERGPIPLGVFQKFVRLRDPYCLAAALHPVVENDARGFSALADAGAVADHEAFAEADGASGIVGGGGNHIEGGVDRPRSREIVGMCLAGIDYGFELCGG